ncbi:MAG: hypothetical protein EXR07_01980 [Acetobacteraceae bacterium]|nr:hypothetical protein [Acetobacteraceae bacterium]
MSGAGIRWGLPGVPIAPPLPGADDFCTTPLLDLLRASAERAPDAIALTGQTGHLRYADLLRLILNAAASVAALVPPGGSVACVLPRTPEAMAGLIGCLVSGRPCLIVDPAAPAERLAGLLEDAAPTAAMVNEPLPFRPAMPVLMLADALEGPGQTWRPDVLWDPDAPCAIHFTSGSTGRPKGIALSARSVLYRGLHGAVSQRWVADDRIYTQAIPAGSNGLSTLLAALAKGARLVLSHLPSEGASAVLRLFEREALTVAIAPSTIFRMLFPLRRSTAAFGALRLVRIGAGSLPKTDLAAWRAALPRDCAIQHTYASTEALVVAQWFVPPGDEAAEPVLAAGMLQPTHDHAILDEDGDPVAPGETGELVLRSRYLALGEWRGGTLVPGAMVPAPGYPGSRVFRTGDLVRIRKDGLLCVVGRADRQVKINGVRIEPEEIEAVLRADPRVAEAAIVAITGTAGVTLHAFVAAKDGDRADLVAVLRQRLAAALPAVSRPASLTVLDRLPALPGGKIDLIALSNWPRH